LAPAQIIEPNGVARATRVLSARPHRVGVTWVRLFAAQFRLAPPPGRVAHSLRKSV